MIKSLYDGFIHIERAKMTDLMQLKQDWRTFEETALAAKEALAQKAAPLAEKIAVFKAEKSPGIAGWFSRLVKSVKLIPTRWKLRGLNNKIADQDAALADQARNVQLQLEELAVAAAPAEIGKKYGELKTVFNKVVATDRIVRDAAQSCSQASNMEMIDALSKNKTITILAGLSTSNASGDIKRAQRAVRELQSYIQDHPIDTREIGGNLDMLNTVNIAVGLLTDGGLLDTFTSFSAMNQLNEARGQLNNISGKISTVANEFEKNMIGVRKAALNAGMTEPMKALVDGLKPYIGPKAV